MAKKKPGLLRVMSDENWADIRAAQLKSRDSGTFGDDGTYMCEGLSEEETRLELRAGAPKNLNSLFRKT